MGQSNQAIDESGSRPTSVPPEAKVIAARGAAFVAAVGALTDVVGALVIGVLIYAGRMEPDPWGWVLAGLAGGTIIGKARGGSGGTTSGLLLGLGAGKALGASKGAKALTLAKKALGGLWLG